MPQFRTTTVDATVDEIIIRFAPPAAAPKRENKAAPCDLPPKAANPITAEQLIAAFTLDAPVPVRVLYGLYGSRSTFHKWRRKGLNVKTIEGMGPTIIPSEFRNFLRRLRDATGRGFSPAFHSP